MDIFEVSASLPHGRYLVEGEFRDLPIGETIVIEFDDESRMQAVVETRTLAGVVVKGI